MVAEVIGFRKVDFTDKESGRVIQGTSVFYLSDLAPKGFGKEGVKLFVPETVCPYSSFQVGKKYQFEKDFNTSKLVSCTCVDK